MQLKLDKVIPLEDKVFDLIRDEVTEPLTLSEIRHRIEKKYDTYLSVAEKDGYRGCYYMHPMRNERLTAAEGNKSPSFTHFCRVNSMSLMFVSCFIFLVYNRITFMSFCYPFYY